MAPIQDALSVPEVLEEITLNLPLRQIVQMRAVCREICRIIDQTSTIQRSLFLQPSSAESLIWKSPFELALSGTYAPGSRASDIKEGSWKTTSEPHSFATTPFLNPFYPITQDIDQDLPKRQWYTASFPDIMVDARVTTNEDEDEMPAFDEDDEEERIRIHFPRTLHHQHRNSDLFKNMLLTHPPTKWLMYTVPFNEKVIVHSNAGGITFGDVMEGHVEPQYTSGEISFAKLVSGGHKIALLSKTTDVITAHEMLAILDTGFDELAPINFVHDEAGRIKFALN